MNIGEEPKNLSSLNIFTFIKEIYASIKIFNKKIDNYQKEMNSNFQSMKKIQNNCIYNISKNHELLETIHKLLDDRNKLDNSLKNSLETKLGNLISENIETNQKIQLDIQDLSFGNIIDNEYNFGDINNTLVDELKDNIGYNSGDEENMDGENIDGDGNIDGENMDRDGNIDGNNNDGDGNIDGDGNYDVNNNVNDLRNTNEFNKVDELNQIKNRKKHKIRAELHNINNLLTSDTQILNDMTEDESNLLSNSIFNFNDNNDNDNNDNDNELLNNRKLNNLQRGNFFIPNMDTTTTISTTTTTLHNGGNQGKNGKENRETIEKLIFN
jgi:hypothetical protein